MHLFVLMFFQALHHREFVAAFLALVVVCHGGIIVLGVRFDIQDGWLPAYQNVRRFGLEVNERPEVQGDRLDM